MTAPPLSRSMKVTVAFRMSPGEASPAASPVAVMSLMVALRVTVALPELVLDVVANSPPE